MHLKKRLRGTLSDGQVKKIRAYQSHHFRGLQHAAFSLLFGSNLKALAILYGTDKWSSHWYAPHYHANFHPLRRKKISGSSGIVVGSSLR
ncbi:hypothetical protein [Desulfohalovibrio reitneri]|uniref:hypothetical protein n=1 Tax=Desulfohalovibrio reitneri TaxID=1307759 RepID=UPI00110E93F4|nr:hypothetical protein [Desulfohalovibrio reitneri]